LQRILQIAPAQTPTHEDAAMPASAPDRATVLSNRLERAVRAFDRGGVLELPQDHGRVTLRIGDMKLVIFRLPDGRLVGFAGEAAGPPPRSPAS
jgi:hypothetical protein